MENMWIYFGDFDRVYDKAGKGIVFQALFIFTRSLLFLHQFCKKFGYDETGPEKKGGEEMRKVLVIALVVALALALTVPAVALTLTDGQKAELEGLYRQMHELRQQIFEKRVESGLISPEDAERQQERMEERWEAMQQRMAENNYEMGFGKRGSRNRLQAGTTGAEL